MTKLVYVCKTASLCPTSYATNNARQMSVTDEGTRHAQKIMLTSIGLR